MQQSSKTSEIQFLKQVYLEENQVDLEKKLCAS
jgi:hypothetical protein